MKTVALAADLKTPAWVFVSDASSESIADVIASLDFPIIVKHFQSYSSIGLTKQNRVDNEVELKERVEAMVAEFGAALVEEFIEGREFTVLVAEGEDGEPVAFLPVECSFPEDETFKHFNLKWYDYEGLAWNGVQDEDLAERLRDMARKVFTGIRGRGYGRIDVRSDPTGKNLYLLEINPNCGLFYPPGMFGSADMILHLDPQTSHEDFLALIMSTALKRHTDKQPRVQSQWRKGRGFGLFALRDFQVGDIVQRNEECETVLVSKQHVEKHWAKDAAKMRDFGAYAWPVGRNVFATWYADPKKWAPINHCCEPNTWLQGLDTVARTPIKKGAELTIDYATRAPAPADWRRLPFCVGCTPFECACGSALCRKKVTGEDWNDATLMERYAGHFSCHIAAEHLAKAEYTVATNFADAEFVLEAGAVSLVTGLADGSAQLKADVALDATLTAALVE
ncbi:hypothetical protein M885DRAFT_496706 [Pelagophyceae sp. CCMP2097]|nr:hypothetical protein M885DRAFT_496706 [Pelagophyceae sp. CCMP2097]